MEQQFDEKALEEWAIDNIGGLRKLKDVDDYQRICRLLIPGNPVMCHNYLMERIFPKFANLIKIKTQKFSFPVENSAQSLEEIYQHAQLIKPLFIDFIENIIKRSTFHENLSYYPNETHSFLIKPEESLLTKGLKKSYSQINDTLRTSILCPSILCMEEMIELCRQSCEERKLSYSILNFMDNYHRLDGYISIHFCIVFTLSMNNHDPIQLMTEIQFQPATLIDPKNRWNSIKYLTHDAFRTAKYLKGAGEYEDCQHAIEMYNVYGLSTFY